MSEIRRRETTTAISYLGNLPIHISVSRLTNLNNLITSALPTVSYLASCVSIMWRVELYE